VPRTIAKALGLLSPKTATRPTDPLSELCVGPVETHGKFAWITSRFAVNPLAGRMINRQFFLLTAAELDCDVRQFLRMLASGNVLPKGAT
jgi:hypothetical protein